MGRIRIYRQLDGIEGLCAIEPEKHEDGRGYLIETFNRRDMEEAGLACSFVQDNQSMSVKGVLRGLHFQKRFPQTKLVRVIAGRIYDVAVDLRKESPTYGKYHGELLTADSQRQILIPRGFAHGFLTLSDEALLSYKFDEFYRPDDEGGLAWNDPAVGIAWPELVGEYPGDASAGGHTLTDGTPLSLSERDRKWPGLKNTFSF